MSGSSCHIRNLRTESLSGFFAEKDALSAGGHYLTPDSAGWLDATGLTGLCIVCENCGSVIGNASGEEELCCSDCGESSFRVIQTYRLITIKNGFVAHWQVPGLQVAIDVPDDVRANMSGIYYTLDGKDPTQASRLYSGLIPYRKDYAPIRAAVFYRDARSQIIEWDYGRAETNRKRIQKESNPYGTDDSFHDKPKEPSAPKPIETDVPKKKDPDEGKGCGCLLVIAMGIGGMVLIGNGWSVVGWILVVVGALMLFGMSQDNKK